MQQSLFGGSLFGDSPRHTVIFDGGSKGNPGLGYGSFLIKLADGSTISKQLSYERLGLVTNNQAEYMTLINALEALAKHIGAAKSSHSVRVEGDSQLVLNQLKGSWKVRNLQLKPLHQRARELANQFGSIEYVWHPRSVSVAVLGH
jgi:ribonuclease HI